MKKLLWVGDGPDCPSGFGRATREIIRHLDYRQEGPYDVTVLGINHLGDPGTVPYPVYAAAVTGDMMGVERLIWMCDLVKPDILIIQHDGWNITPYVKRLRLFKEYDRVQIVAIVAVDGKNFDGKWLDGIDRAVFWTQFGLDEAREGGYGGDAVVIPLGVDTSIYRPKDQLESRRKFLPEELHHKFLIGNVNRNQPRKRWDLTIKYFAEWVRSRSIPDAHLFLHTAPTGDVGVKVKELMEYYGVVDRLILRQPPTWYGLSEDEMADTYNCFDLVISTTQGEGMGLTALEAMACGVPVIAPDWAAFGDWGAKSMRLVPCYATEIGWPFVNVIGGVADQAAFTDELDVMYQNHELREEWAARAFSCATNPIYRWETIGAQYRLALGKLEPRVAVQKELVKQEV